VKTIKRLLLRLALGETNYRLLVKTVLESGGGLGRAKSVDVVTRRDAVERRYEADWARELGRLFRP
jgi:hypothetical protein